MSPKQERYIRLVSHKTEARDPYENTTESSVRCVTEHKRKVRDWDWPLIVMALFIGGVLVAAWL